MTKKVFELARELGVSSKELISKAAEAGIKVKTHMSVLSDSDIETIGKVMHKDTGASEKKSSGIGVAVVDEEYLANKHKGPKEQPIVDEAYFERKKEEKKESEELKTAPEKPVTEGKPEAAAKEQKAEKQEAPEKKQETGEEEKPSAGKPAAVKSEKAEKTEKAEEKKTGKQDEKAEEKKKEKKPEEPTIKMAESERISIPKIKIISRGADRKKAAKKKAEEKKSQGQNNKRGDRNERGSRNDRRSSNEGGNRRRHSGSAPAASSGGENAGGSSGNSRGKKFKSFHDRPHNKFEKFERKSLEKKERKKYVSKQKEVEPEIIEEVLPEGTFKLDVPITVAGFCEQTDMSTSNVIMTLMKMGIMANINQVLDEDTVQLLAEELGITVVVGEVEQEEVEEGIEDFEDDEKDLKPRPPVITVMGHVDHGKTSILDAIRKTNVTAKEYGGITQHIGASEVQINGKKIVFLDTPGHEAFTAMRARGAQITDIAVLVVAADDSVKPQTVESISHAKAAGVPMIVAINKMDKPGANPDRVKKDLADHGVLVEDWGGEVISVPVSAKTGEGIKELLEMILLQADMMELKANPDRLAMGSVIEARLDKARGPVATLLVTNGTLKAGQSIVAGTCSGRIRLMTDYKGKKIRKAGPATAVEVLGLTDVPQAGDNFNAVKDDKTARSIAQRRSEKLREETMTRNSSMSLEKLFSQIKEGETKELNLVVKADVQGSVGAMVTSLEKLNNDEVKVNVIHSGVGTVNESDVMLAGTSNAVIIGFNVRPSSAVSSMADQQNVEIRLYTVIYDALNDVEAAMKGMLEPDVKEELLGKATIRDTFKVPGVGIIGGAYVTEGKLARNAQIRLVRNGILIHEGKISSLKRFKDDAKEVNQGYECGIGIEDYNDIKVDDTIECFHMVEVKKED